MFLEAENLKKSFKKGKVRAVRGISFGLEKGRTLGVVGESGSGKSTLLKLVLRLLPADEGRIIFEGNDITRSSERNLKVFRKKVQVVFQNPYLSLDPRMNVADILREPFLLSGRTHGVFLGHEIRKLLLSVDLSPRLLTQRPHQLSGGECQRVALARAISLEPELVVCDEPVSSLDLLAQAHILNLLLKLQQERGMAYIFVSHDLRAVRHMSDEVMVMKDGEVCEIGVSDEIFNNPKQPYTRSLIQQSTCQETSVVL